VPRSVLVPIIVYVLCGQVALAQETPDPTVVLDMYMICIGRGNYEDALTYCKIPGQSDPQAISQLRDAMTGIAGEIDLVGVAKALSLFVPLSLSPMEWRAKAAPITTPTEATLSVTASTTLTFDQTIYFVRSGPQWKIDMGRTFRENAVGTRVERMLLERTSLDEAKAQLDRVAQAMKRYLADHEGRLPSADTWQADLLAYGNILTASDLVSPLAPAAQPTYGMNRGLGGLSDREITGAANVVLIFDAAPGVTSGGPDDLVLRHRGQAVALLADGTVVTMRNASDYGWGPRSPGGSRAGAPVQPTPIAGVEYVPLKDILTRLGGEVTWRAAEAVSVATCQGHTAVIRANDKSVRIDEKLVTFPVAPVTVDSRLLVPASLPSRAFGLSARWTEQGIEYR